MNYSLFGTRTGLAVSELALGTAMFGTTSGYGAAPDEVRSILTGYLDAGGNLIDSSDFYQGGESERLIGEFIGPHRHNLVLISKYGRSVVDTTSPVGLGNHRKAMIQSVEASLKRLKTDYIDLYFPHFNDRVTPVEEIVRGLDDLVRSGKIIYGGLSNFPAWRVATAVTMADFRGLAPVASVQLEYSLLQRTTERELLPMAGAFGLGVLAYSPMAGGRLTGKYRRGETGRVTQSNQNTRLTPAQETVLDVLDTIAAETGINPGQAAISWVRAKGVFPVVGPRTRAQLDENLVATQLDLTPDQVNRLDAASEVSLGYPHELPDRAILTQNGRFVLNRPDRTVL